MALLERIADGRTDLVFAHIAQEGSATARDEGGVSLLQWCAYYGDVSAVRYLLLHGESLSGLGENLDLNGACFHGHWQLCQFLIEQGADVNHPLPDTGETPLHAALAKTRLPHYNLVLQVLLAAGAKVDVATKAGVETGSFMRDCRTKGETPLHRAAAFGDEEAIQMLLAAGAVVDARDANGDTPLSWASWYLRPGSILSLLCYGPHRIHPERARRGTGDPYAGTGGMERELRGKPHR
jgi:ankyrin repeat protein